MTQKQYAKMVIENVQIIKKRGTFVVAVGGKEQRVFSNRDMLEIANWIIGRIAFEVK